MASLMTAPSQGAAEAVSRVTHIVGNASLTHNNENQGPGLGMSIESGDVLETGSASIMDASLNGLIGLRLLPLTKVVVLRLDSEEPQIQLIHGNVVGLVRKNPRSFKVETPEADLRIQAGQFWARYEKENVVGASFCAFEGKARISPKNSSVLTLESKQAVDISRGAALESRWASANEIQAVKRAEDIEIQ